MIFWSFQRSRVIWEVEGYCCHFRYFRRYFGLRYLGRSNLIFQEYDSNDQRLKESRVNSKQLP